MYCIRTMSPQSLDCWVARRRTPGPTDEKVPNEPVVPMLTPVQLPVEGGAVQVASRVWEGGIVMSQRLLPELSATVADEVQDPPVAGLSTGRLDAHQGVYRLLGDDQGDRGVISVDAAVEPPSARTTVQVKPLTAVTLRYSSSMRARNVPEEGMLAVVLTVIDVAELGLPRRGSLHLRS